MLSVFEEEEEITLLNAEQVIQYLFDHALAKRVQTVQYDHAKVVLQYDDNNENLVRKLYDEDQESSVCQFDILWRIVFDDHSSIYNRKEVLDRRGMMCESLIQKRAVNISNLSLILTSLFFSSYCAIASYSCLS